MTVKYDPAAYSAFYAHINDAPQASKIYLAGFLVGAKGIAIGSFY